MSHSHSAGNRPDDFDHVCAPGFSRFQKLSALTTSPPARVPSARQTWRLIESLMNLTDPSPASMFTPPGCRLDGGMTARSARKKPHDRESGPETWVKMCCPHSQGAPMNNGNWLCRS